MSMETEELLKMAFGEEEEEGEGDGSVNDLSNKLQATKRKLKDSYDEAERAKKQRRLIVLDCCQLPKGNPRSKLIQRTPKKTIRETSTPKKMMMTEVAAAKMVACCKPREVKSEGKGLGCLDEGMLLQKLAATRKRLSESYRQAADAKKRHRLMVLQHPPKFGLACQ